MELFAPNANVGSANADGDFEIYEDSPDSKDPPMTDPSHPSRLEVDAKLETVEARLDAKLATIDGKLDRLFDRMEVVVSTAQDAKEAANKARESASNIKWNIIFTAMGAVATLLAAWAIWSQGMELVAGILGARGV